MKVQSLKSSTAQKLRGNGLIHYRLIIHNKKLYLVLQKNDDGGHFSNEIVSYERISECVEGLEEPVFSRVFRSAFDSKSTNNAVFPHEDFAPSFEFIEEHHDFYEMVFVLTDDNTTVFIIPKEKVDPLLLSLCQEFS